MFTLTIIKLIEDRKSDQFNNPLMKSLYYYQIVYNVVSAHPACVRLKTSIHPSHSLDRS